MIDTDTTSAILRLKETAEAQENRLLLETVTDYAIFFIDPNGVVTRWGIGAEKMELYRAEEVIGQDFALFYTEEDKAIDWPQHNLEKAREQGRYEEVRLRLRKGYIPFWADVLITPLYDSDSELLGFSKIIKDVSGQKEWEERLEQSNRDLQQFATIASHDLQGPLRKVERFGQHLKAEAQGKISLEGLDDLDRMLRATHKMQYLIQDLLDLSKVNKTGETFRPMELADVVHEVISDLAPAIEESKGRVEVGSLMKIDADYMQMHQLFQNLISNALKFHQDRVPPIVKVWARPLADNRCEILVQDNGIGFKEEQADIIFDVFERLQGPCAFEGTGVGLSICKRIVERHHGAITAHSKPCEGATFIINLPVKQPIRD